MQACRVELLCEVRRLLLSLALLYVLASLQVVLSSGQGQAPTGEPPTATPPVGMCVNGTCENDLCCSKYGYCGSTPLYCGDGCQGANCISSASPSASDTESSSGKADSPMSSSASGKAKSPMSIGIIVGIVVGGVLAIILTGIVIFKVWRRTIKDDPEGGNVIASNGGKFGSHDGGKVDSYGLEAKSLEKWSTRPTTLTETLSNITGTLSFQHSEFGRRLSYEALHSATNGFSQEIGRGAFGIVYKGTLQDGTEIAVKQLVDSERDVKDFEAEVKTLGCINHTNLVALVGFTFDNNTFFLIYEYVANKSLDHWIFEGKKGDTSFVLPWKSRVDILRGTAKGLIYLHEELQRGRAIVHLDIKPQNILLDKSYVPKIADFGLAKLLGSVGSHQTLPAGGTKGYMAPEVYVGVANPKMDVYSFGMLMLEVVSGREHVDYSRPPESFFVPAWAIRKLYEGEQLDVVDPLLDDDQFDPSVATRLIWIALMCLQRDPDLRPGMSTVLKMIEGGGTPPDLPPTLQPELEMAERIIRKKPTGDSVNFIKFSGDTNSQSSGPGSGGRSRPKAEGFPDSKRRQPSVSSIF